MSEALPNAADAAFLRTRMERREVSSRDIVAQALARIETVNPRLNCFVRVFSDEALAAAAAADQARRQGHPLGPLHGIPVAIKDVTPVAGHVTTHGSHIFAHNVSDTDAITVRRLRAAGAVIIGKTTTPEFAHGGFTESPLLGITRNPWSTERTPGGSSGGSSGGSAAAVASGCVPLAEGTDMGGSIRSPAAFCGVAGLKPSLGRIPLEHSGNIFESIAHAGPIARSVADLATYLAVCAGPAAADIRSLPPQPGAHEAPANDVRGIHVAVSPDLGYYEVDDDVAHNLTRACEALRDRGAIVEPVELSWCAGINAAWYRYWQVCLRAQYGHHLAEWRERMSPTLVALMESADRISATEFKRIDLLRTRQWHALAAVMQTHDVLLCPTTARTAPPVGAIDESAVEAADDGRCRESELTHPFNFVSQCPVAAVPTGRAADGLPTSAQVVGQRYDEGTVLRVCAALEAVDLGG